MTVGLALAACSPTTGPVLALLADTRFSFGTAPPVDTGPKLYSLGGRVSAVAAGSAVSALSAAQLTQSVIETHNHQASGPIGFCDATRIFSFFLRRLCSGTSLHNETVMAGFLQAGRPALAFCHISPAAQRLAFFSAPDNDHVALAVGSVPAKKLLLHGLQRAQTDDRRLVASAASLVWYMSKHQGHPSIGGGVSCATCDGTDPHWSWPVLEIVGQRFLRGLDVTASYRATWPPPVPIDYDEDWCTSVDKDHEIGEASARAARVKAYNIDDVVSEENLFQLHDDPEGF